MRHKLVWLSALAAPVLLVPSLAARAGTSPLPQGCGVDARTATFHSDGSPAAGAAPAVCVMSTGYAAAETHIRVATDGTVVEEPALITGGLAGTGFLQGTPGPKPESQLSVAGLAVSSSQGATWDFVKPGGATWVGQDASLHIDRATGRLYYYGLTSNPAPQGGDVPLTEQVPSAYAHLLSTKDGGKTWNSVSLPGFVNSENPRFATGPAPATAGAAVPVPGEQIAYWCGNNMLFTMAARLCYRSLDGGATWVQRSILFTKGVPQHTECGSNGEDFSAGDGNYPEAGPDGSLWVLVSCGGQVFLARSTDEGATWPILRKTGTQEPLTIPATDELRVDPLGNLYAAHLNGRAIELRVSRDGGQSWSTPVNMTAPAARASDLGQWAFAVRAPGQAAASYLSVRSDSGYDGYITVTANALDPIPTLVSSPVNPAGTPLVTSSTSAKDDFIDVDLGPDGSAWAAYYADCAPGSTDPACADGGASTDPLRKMTTIGRLVMKRGTA